MIIFEFLYVLVESGWCAPVFNSRQVYDYQGTCYMSEDDLTSHGQRLLPVSYHNFKTDYSEYFQLALICKRRNTYCK